MGQWGLGRFWGVHVPLRGKDGLWFNEGQGFEGRCLAHLGAPAPKLMPKHKPQRRQVHMRAPTYTAYTHAQTQTHTYKHPHPQAHTRTQPNAHAVPIPQHHSAQARARTCTLGSGADPRSTNCPPRSKARYAQCLMRGTPFWGVSRLTCACVYVCVCVRACVCACVCVCT